MREGEKYQYYHQVKLMNINILQVKKNLITNQNTEKFIIALNILCLFFFLRDMHEGFLSLKDTDNEQNKFANKLKSIDKGIKSIEKNLFLNNMNLFFTARENVLNDLYFN